ncbi:MAG: metallophosphoesterase family protein [Gaiellaceae bacterium]
MRIALLADMHGNAVAFRAALADLEAREPDLIVALGDVAQGGPQPRECVDLLRELDCPCVYGNSDHFLVTLDPGGETADERQLETARWSREQLGDDGLAFLRSFRPTVQAGRILCCHATPTSNEDVVLPTTDPDTIAQIDADAVAAGHVHLQWLRRLGRTLWFCVGAVGISRYCEYALADADTLAVEFRRIPFDVDELLAAARTAGFPFYEQWAPQWRS